MNRADGSFTSVHCGIQK